MQGCFSDTPLVLEFPYLETTRLVVFLRLRLERIRQLLRVPQAFLDLLPHALAGFPRKHQSVMVWKKRAPLFGGRALLLYLLAVVLVVETSSRTMDRAPLEVSAGAIQARISNSRKGSVKGDTQKKVNHSWRPTDLLKEPFMPGTSDLFPRAIRSKRAHPLTHKHRKANHDPPPLALASFPPWPTAHRFWRNKRSLLLVLHVLGHPTVVVAEKEGPANPERNCLVLVLQAHV